MTKISIPPLSEYYNFDRLEDALTDAIFSITIQNIIKDYNLTPQDVPADYRDLLE
jgi:hypothetical protein